MTETIDGDIIPPAAKKLTIEDVERGIELLNHFSSYEQIRGVIDCLVSVYHDSFKKDDILTKIQSKTNKGILLLRQQYKDASRAHRSNSVQTNESSMLQQYAICTSTGDVHNLLGPNPATDTMKLSTLGIVKASNGIEFDTWLKHPNKIVFYRVRMNPALPSGIYIDESERAEVAAKYLNSYNPPLHDEVGGSYSVFFRFLESLIPDVVERKWYLQSLAYKFQHPEIRGPAVVMVANKTYGTGRGTLAKLIGALFGKQYVRTVNAGTFLGNTYQSQYTDWLVGNLFVFVNELGKQTGKGAWAEKAHAYEIIKEQFDPAPTEMYTVRKGVQSTDDDIFATGHVFTNNFDAIPIPEGDRRIAVITNGKQLDPQFKDELNAAINDPACVAAFARFLARYDVSAFRPYDDPPVFAGKARMIEHSLSDLDRAVDEALTVIKDMPAFTEEQIVSCITKLALNNDWHLPDMWQNIVRALLESRCHRIAQRGERNYRVRVDGKQQAVYVRTSAEAETWRLYKNVATAVAPVSKFIHDLDVSALYKAQEIEKNA